MYLEFKVEVLGKYMKSIYPAVIICIVITVISGVVFFHKNSINIIKSPPESLAQWYKPHNKRQVWLHNMFKLRRQMQAIAFYADIKHEKNLKKWTKQFSEHYIKIATMVPQWAKKIDRDALSALHNKVKNNNYQEIDLPLKEIEQTCNNCHDDYRAITAIKYRAPDFSKLQVNSKAYSYHMKKLSHTVNQIKIASVDNMKDIANESFHNLESGIIELGKTCINCHKNKKQTYIYRYC